MKKLIFSLFVAGFYTACFAANDAELKFFTDDGDIIHYFNSPYAGRLSGLGNFNSGYCGLEPELREMILDEPTPKAVTISKVGHGDWFEGE